MNPKKELLWGLWVPKVTSMPLGRCRALVLAAQRPLVAEWIHFALFWIILPTTKLKVYTFWCV